MGCVAIWPVTVPRMLELLEEAEPPILHMCNEAQVVIGVEEGRARFSGLNVVYDAEGYEYPVDDQGMICFPEGEKDNGTENEEKNQ